MKVNLRFKRVVWIPRVENNAWEIKNADDDYFIIFDEDKNTWDCYYPSVGVKSVEGLEKAKTFVVNQLRKDIQDSLSFCSKFLSESLVLENIKK